MQMEQLFQWAEAKKEKLVCIQG